MPYTELTMEEGRRFLPSVQNLFFKPLGDANFFVEPWKNRELADCAEFRLNGGEDGSDEVLFFVSDNDILNFLKKSEGDIYLFGAYNQLDVCQMRARGKVILEESHPEVEQIKVRLRRAIESRVRAFDNKLNEHQAKHRYYIIDKGKLFRFQINAYAYQMYERG